MRQPSSSAPSGMGTLMNSAGLIRSAANFALSAALSDSTRILRIAGSSYSVATGGELIWL